MIGACSEGGLSHKRAWTNPACQFRDKEAAASRRKVGRKGVMFSPNSPISFSLALIDVMPLHAQERTNLKSSSSSIRLDLMPIKVQSQSVAISSPLLLQLISIHPLLCTFAIWYHHFLRPVLPLGARLPLSINLCRMLASRSLQPHSKIKILFCGYSHSRYLKVSHKTQFLITFGM